MLNAEGFASKFWPVILGDPHHDYLLGTRL